MPRTVVLDFTDAPPAQGGGGFDHVPPGRYAIKLTQISEERAKSSNRKMIVARWEVATGDQTGKSLSDRFVVEGDAKFGRQRLHACLLALTLPVAQKKIKIDLDTLSGRSCVALVVDEEIPASENYPSRMGSRIQAYFPIESKNGSSEQKPAKAVAKAEAPAPLPGPEPEPDDDGDDVADLGSDGDDDVIDMADSVDSLFE